MMGCAASEDQPDLLTAERIDENQYSSCTAHSNGNEPLFVLTIGVLLMHRQWIVKNTFCVREGNPVLS